MPVSVVTTMDEWRAVHLGGDYAIVAYTTHWCEPSQRSVAEFRRLSDSRTRLNFITVDVEDAEDVSHSCGISLMPAFHVRRCSPPPAAGSSRARPLKAHSDECLPPLLLQIYKDGTFIESVVGSSTHQLQALADRYNAT
jgi:hypothetical protein